MLNRLGIRQRLSLLLTFPLVAVVLVMVPFTTERIGDAQSATSTARIANAAREIGGLIQTLQQERLLALGYLAVSTLDRSAVLAKSQESVDAVANLRSDPAAAEVLNQAERELADLDGIRQRVIDRTVSAASAYGAYRAANTALLVALSLGNRTGVDAAGVRELGALDALMRSNEEASSVGAILVAASVDRLLSRLLTNAQTADEQHLSQFRELVADGQADLIDAVENGAARRRIREISQRIGLSDAPSTPAEISAALTAAVSYTDLRRLAQDRVARDIAVGADERASSATAVAWSVVGGASLLLIIVAFMGITVSRSISTPLRRLTQAAGVVAELSAAELMRVADSDAVDAIPPKLAAIDIDSADEIGELATVLNRVQATAALLLDRQVTTRRNVSVMFANIARRTQNLVGRQLALIDDLERNERNPELLQRLHRLDHIATRLRRSADSLLVVSGTIDQSLSGTPTGLTEVVHSSLTEIEGFRAVEIGEICEVAVAASVVGDLRLLLTELLENATSFSPPGTPVEVTATLDGGCEIRIVDHGVGLSAVRMAEENRRLVERERLDLAPTTVLGLFVVGRLTRRHGMAVRLEASTGRGVTAVVKVPQRLLTPGPVPPGRPPSTVRVGPARMARQTIDAIEVPQPYGTFPWFAAGNEQTAIAAEPRVSESMSDTLASITVWGDLGPLHGQAASATPPAWPPPLPPVTSVSTGPPAPDARLCPPAPGPADAATESAPSSSPLAPPPLPHPVGAGPLPRRDVGANIDPAKGDFGARLDADAGRDGLYRRNPGSHMAEAVRDALDEPTARIPRDPEAERRALNDYLSGLARGDDATGAHPSQPTLAERPR